MTGSADQTKTSAATTQNPLRPSARFSAGGSIGVRGWNGGSTALDGSAVRTIRKRGEHAGRRRHAARPEHDEVEDGKQRS